MILVSRNIR